MGDSTNSIGVINFSGLFPTSQLGWFYQGSLTTPPLSQEVNWLVLATPIMLDFAQFHQYEAVAAGAGFLPNNRPFQPADGRRTNEFNDNVDFESLNVANLNFTVSPTLNTASTKAAKSRANA